MKFLPQLSLVILFSDGQGNGDSCSSCDLLLLEEATQTLFLKRVLMIVLFDLSGDFLRSWLRANLNLTLVRTPLGVGWPPSLCLWKIFKDVILSTAAWVKGQQTGQAADRLKKPRRNCGKKVLSVRNSLY